jgi:hypothetical protein
MQTVISSFALTFVDDAIALTTGFASVCRDLVRSGIAGVHERLWAPIERLARSCDVACVLPAAPARGRKRFDVLGLFAPFRALRDLT